MEVSRLWTDLTERVVDLIVQRHLLVPDVFQRDPTTLGKRHWPVAVEGTPISHKPPVRKPAQTFPSHTQRNLRLDTPQLDTLIFPIKTEDAEARQLPGSHPDLLDRPRPVNQS